MAQAEVFLLLNLFTLIGFGVAFLAIYSKKRRLKYALHFGIAWLACSGAFVSDILIRPSLPTVVGANISYLLFSVSIYFLSKGLYARSDKHFPQTQYLLLIGLAHVVITLVGLAAPNSTAGVLAADYILGFAVLLLAIDLIGYRKTIMDKVVVGAVWFAAIVMLVQPTLILFVVQEQVTEANYSDSIYAFVLYFSISLLSLPLSGSLLAATVVELFIKLSRQSMSDELTKLLNSNAFEEVSQSVLETCRATGKDVSIAVLQIEDFGQLRALQGRAVSDYTLKLVADAIQRKCAGTLTVARIDQARFAILMPSYDENNSAEVISSIRQEIRNLELPGSVAALRGGIAAATAVQGETFEQLSKRAAKSIRSDILCSNESKQPAMA